MAAVCVTPTASSAATPCDLMTAPIYHRDNPTLSTSLLTRSATESSRAASNYGFTLNYGTAVAGASRAATGLVPVHRLYSPARGDFMWTLEGGDLSAAVAAGYTDQGINFYALPKSGVPTCANPVQVFSKGTKHRYAASSAERSALSAAGWSDQGTAFAAKTLAVPDPGTDTRFSIAVLPDTQGETTNTSDQRFANRTSWLAASRSSLDLRYVVGSGDTVNWGWLVPSQFSIASNAMRNLENGGIPYVLPLGNHDTRAVGWNGIAGSRGYGGSAYASNPECPSRLGSANCKTNLLVRHTEEFNAAFPASRYRGVGGAFQSGKVDNIYTTFSAGGKTWLVLALELWPRPEVVNWARGVVAANPRANVIVATHSYLASDGRISQSNGGYGSTSPQYLYDNLIKLYPNIKMVVSGHVGNGASRTDTGVNGNKILSLLQAFHSATTNPTRLVDIDTAAGTVNTRIYAPYTNETWTSYATSTAGMSFVG